MDNAPYPLSSLADLKKMALADLQGLADDIRQMIISTCLTNGGHLGASLGTVELAIALHFVFDSPQEPILWDVGHQAYAHKLLTGRWSKFHTLRLRGGISGFLAREESEHDVFGAGHSSTALSAALGMSYARLGSNRWTVAVVGDGGLTAGVAFEALNNVKATGGGPLLLVLNDNQMSISQNVGALPTIFASGEVKKYFELFGFDYIGPVNGHDLSTLIAHFESVRGAPGGRPVVLHVHTQKGKGYIPAEESPAAYHGVSPVQSKVVGATPSVKQKTYSEAFGEAMVKLAESDPKIIAITAAMAEGTGLTEFARRFPERFFDVGIAEPHAMTFAAGLATQGFRPVVAIYSTFLQRSLDAIIHDVALQGLGVTLAIDRAGLVGADGPTHHGMFDLAFLGMIPGMTISAPACLNDLGAELRAATQSGRPWAIRYPRGGAAELLTGVPGHVRWLVRPEKPGAIVIGLGSAGSRALAAAQSIDPLGKQIAVAVVVRAKPIDPELVLFVDGNSNVPLLIVEDGVARGGFGQALKALLRPRMGRVELAAYRDEFVPHGSPAQLEESVGLSQAALAVRLKALYEKTD